MQPITLDPWSSQASIAHRLDARVKLGLLISFIVSIGLIRHPSFEQLALAFLTLSVIALVSRLPTTLLLVRSLLVIPVVGPFAAILFVSGDHARAWFVVSKSYLSTSAVLLAVSTTTFPELLSAARWFRLPSMLVEVTQLIYRYLFVLGSQAQQMRTAFAARSGSAGKHAFWASAGMVAVLFGRSYDRAVFTHQAMLARGFEGALPATFHRPVGWTDLAIFLAGLSLSVAVHFLP